jgi:nitrile hydratase
MKPRFRPGDRVRVRAVEVPGHTRTPGYLKGRRGVVERFCGLFRNPEELAYGRAGFPEKAVYRVRFPLRTLWPEYAGGPDDILVADLYEHWLDGGPGRATAGGAGTREPPAGAFETSAASASAETQTAYHRRLEVAVRELLVEKGVLTPEELRRQVADTDARTAANGAAVVARAWRDPAFRARMLADARIGCRDCLGIDIGELPRIIAVEDTRAVHNVIVSSLGGSYPRSLIGSPPAWYTSTEYRARVVREPRTVLAEFGTRLPTGMSVRVHDMTADLRVFVIPLQPPNTDGWSEERLARLVTRDMLIGVALPHGIE